ncbi:uncharacterized protein [Henckelia pumila]|uniref:uncharacterized protein n=1 Tax=Henckelia pumila TaxID=405737 RepID=UPI003C6E1014
MKAKYEIEKFNGRNFLLWKLKVQEILAKERCLEAIGDRPTEITDDQIWNEMNHNVVSNLHLAIADEVLSKKSRRKNKDDRLATLKQEEALPMTRVRLTEHDSSESHRYGRSKSRSKNKNIYCFKCSGKGHFKRECTKSIEKGYQGNVASTLGDGEILCSEAATVAEGRHIFSDAWIMDSGPTWHMTSRRKWFNYYEPVSGGSVLMGNDHALEIAGVGTIKIKMFDGTIRTIQEIVKGALVVMKADNIVANLYVLMGETHKEAELVVALVGSGEESTVLWHRKLGHMSELGMKILSERKLLPGLTKVTLPFCEHCVTSKQPRLKFGTSIAKSKGILELIHSDVWQEPEFLLWYPTVHKLIINRDVIFEEDKVKEDKGTLNSETTIIQVENKTDEDHVSYEAVPEHEVQEPVESEVSKVRQSTRERRPPGWLSNYVTKSNIAYCLLTEDGEPSSFLEAIQSSDVSLWMTAMQEKFEALDMNKTWDLVTLPRGRKAIVRVVLAMCAVFKLYLEQLYVKTTFLHGDLEEEIYMLQPEDFAKKGKENLTNVRPLYVFQEVREDADVSSTVCISSGKFNVRYDLYKTRHCASSGSSHSVYGESWTKALEHG